MDNTQLVIGWAKYLLELNKSQPGHMHYSEGSNRMHNIGQWPIQYPITTDCSGSVTLYCWLAGVADPNGTHYDHEGYTGTLLSHDAHVSQWVHNAQGVEVANVRPGDLVIYGAGTGDHVALIIEVTGGDILTISHGQEGDPSYVWVNHPTGPDRGHATDGRQPQTFLRPNYTQVMAPKPIPGTTPEASQTAPQAPVTPPVHVQVQTDTTANTAQVTAATSSMNKIGLPTVKLGASGQIVKEIQQHLHIKDDGIFGPTTEQAVKDFQAKHRLPVDGIVGPQTWTALGI